MRTERIAKRWNLKTRAKAGRYLQNWEQRLTEGMLNVYKAGYADRAMEDVKPKQEPA
jgi:hypothetical protein